MHTRLRIAFSQRMKLLQTDIDVCDACIRHLMTCKDCLAEKDCGVGDELFEGFRLAQSRAKLLAGDTPYVIF